MNLTGSGFRRLSDAAELHRLLGEYPGITRASKANLPDRLPDAADKGDTRAVALMFSAGWPVNATNNSGVTAPHRAEHGTERSLNRDAGGYSGVREELAAGATGP
ncbi:MAG: hypothetical protein ABI026_12275 [Gemmatimonadaceae bacterium]